MRSSSRHMVFVWSLVWLSSCSTISGWWGSDAEDQDSHADQAIDETDRFHNDSAKAEAVRELELKNARFWVRLDEMEREVLRLKGRMRVLEKGLMLGIVPDELIDDADHYPPFRTPVSPGANLPLTNELTPDASKDIEAVYAGSEDEGTVEDMAPIAIGDKQLRYQEILANAQDHFRSGRYGRAIAEYSVIRRDFHEFDQMGSVTYWLGLSWYQLKEFTKAQEIFSQFVNENSSNPWVPRAQLYLARTEYQLGLRERALVILRELINRYPNEDAAEMARMEIDRMERAL